LVSTSAPLLTGAPFSANTFPVAAPKPPEKSNPPAAAVVVTVITLLNAEVPIGLVAATRNL
jgi:hypothetical protein